MNRTPEKSSGGGGPLITPNSSQSDSQSYSQSFPFSPDFNSPPEAFFNIAPGVMALIIPKLERLLSKKNLRKTEHELIKKRAINKNQLVDEEFVNAIWEFVIKEVPEDLINPTDEIQLKNSIRRKILRAYNSIQKKLVKMRKQDNKDLIPVESLLYNIVAQPPEDRGGMRDVGSNKYLYTVQIKRGDSEVTMDSTSIDRIQNFDTNIREQLATRSSHEDNEALISKLNEHEMRVSCFDGDHDADSGIITLSKSMLETWDSGKSVPLPEKVHIPALDVKKIHHNIDEIITEMERLLTNAGIQFAPEEVKKFLWEQVDPTLLRSLQVTQLEEDSVILKNCVHDSSKYMLLTLFDTFAGAIDRGSRKVYDFERIPFSIYNKFRIYGVNVTLISGMGEEYYIITQMKSPRWGKGNSFFTVSHINGGGISQKDAVEIVNARLLAAGLPSSGIQARNESDEEECESSRKSKSIVDPLNPRFTSLCEVIMSDAEFNSGFELLKEETKDEFEKMMLSLEDRYTTKKFRDNSPTSWHYILAYFSYKGMGDESAAAVAFDSAAFNLFKEKLKFYIQSNGDSELAQRISKCQEGLRRKGNEFEDDELRTLLIQFNKFLEKHQPVTIDQITSTLDTYISKVNRANYLCGLMPKPISTLLTSRVGINFSGSSEIPEEAKRMQEKIRGLNHLVVEKGAHIEEEGLEILRKVFMEDVLEYIEKRNKERPESLFLKLIYQLEVIQSRIQSWDSDARGWINRSIKKYREIIAEVQTEEERKKAMLESSEINENISRLLDLGGVAGDICGEMDDYGEDNILAFVRVTGTSRTRNFSIPSYDDESLELVMEINDKLIQEIDLYNFELEEDSDLRLSLCEKSGKIRFKPSIEFLLNLWKHMKETEKINYVNLNGESIGIDNFFIQLLTKRIQSKYGEIDGEKLGRILTSLPKEFGTNFGGGTGHYESEKDKQIRKEIAREWLMQEKEQQEKARGAFEGGVFEGEGVESFMETEDNDSKNKDEIPVAEEMEIIDQINELKRKLTEQQQNLMQQEQHQQQLQQQAPSNLEKVQSTSLDTVKPKKPKKSMFSRLFGSSENAQGSSDNQLNEGGGGASMSSSAIESKEKPKPWFGRLRDVFSRKGGKGGKKINRRTIKKNNSKLMKKSQKRKTIKKNNSKLMKKSKKRKTIKKHKSKSIKKLTRRYKK